MWGQKNTLMVTCPSCVKSNFDVNFTTKSQLSMTLTKKALKTLWEKEKMLVTSIFSFSHNVLYSILCKTNFNFLITFILSSANVFNLDQLKNLSLGKELNNLFRFEVYIFHNTRDTKMSNFLHDNINSLTPSSKTIKIKIKHLLQSSALFTTILCELLRNEI